MRALMKHANRQRGMSLVEVLVALVVLSVGMLGIAVMFVQSVRSSRSAILRTQAVNLVSDMADRVRANANAQQAYDTDEYAGAPAMQSCAPDSDTGSGINCNVEQLAQDDLARWQRSVRAALPALKDGPAKAEVHYFAPDAEGQPERYRIRVAWREPNESRVGGNTAEQLYSYQSDVVLIPRAAVP
jgi:type IV pilus assembly protein PilV